VVHWRWTGSAQGQDLILQLLDGDDLFLKGWTHQEAEGQKEEDGGKDVHRCSHEGNSNNPWDNQEHCRHVEEGDEEDCEDHANADAHVLAS
jgi:hypothetical protein